MNNQSAVNECSFDDLKLQVGTRLQVTVYRDTYKKSYFTNLIGFELGQYILVKPPREGGHDIPLIAGSRVDVKVFLGTTVYTCSSILDTVFKNRFDFAVLSYPSQVRKFQIRLEERIHTHYPIHILRAHDQELDDPLTGTLNDLSVSGAQIQTDFPLGEVGQEVIIMLSLFNSIENKESKLELQAEIRNVRNEVDEADKSASLYIQGVLFRNVNPTAKLLLQSHVHELILKSRAR